MRRRFVWGVPACLYALFCFWYTDCGGPLRSDEIQAYVAAFERQGATPERLAMIRRFMETDSGRQFLMVNALDMAKDPPDVEGAAPGESAEQLMNRYMEHMYKELFKRGCHPVLVGDAVSRAVDLVGIEGAEQWTLAAVLRWRSRRTMMEIAANPETTARHAFKLAALDKTIAFPIEPQLYLSDLRFLLALLLVSGASLTHIATAGRRSQR
jgi:hypothetical protein